MSPELRIPEMALSVGVSAEPDAQHRQERMPDKLQLEVLFSLWSEKGLDLSLENFLLKEQNCNKCAFVVPVYEIATKADHLPANKTELLTYVKTNLARQFHQVGTGLTIPYLLGTDIAKL